MSTIDIYEINDNLIDSLTEDGKILRLSRDFSKLAKNADKVRFVEQILCEYDRIPKNEPRRPKDNAESKRLRQSGNKYFGTKEPSNYFEALELYNKSICFATSNSEDLAIGYANRSAIYFQWKLYEMCLDNIQLAKASGYPGRLMDKLLKREADCLQFINNNKLDSDEFEFIPKLSHPPNPKIPFIADCLELKENENLGRYIVTNRKLYPGQVIAIDEPYVRNVLTEVRYQRCANCLIENELSLIPCPHCTNTLFCSQECMTEAQQTFHQYECPINDILLEYFNKIHLAAIRVTIQAFEDFKSPSKLVAFLNEVKEKVNTFSFDHRNPLTAEQRYHQIHSLESNQAKRSVADLFQRAVIAAVAYHMFMKYTNFQQLLTEESEQNAFLEILFLHLQTSATNFHNLGLVESKNGPPSCGTGAFPFASLLNHSCAPNITRISFGKKLVVFVLDVIDVDGQILDNYGYHHCLQKVEERRNKLKFQYHFNCVCIACTNDYPTYMKLLILSESLKDVVPTLGGDDDIIRLESYDRQFAAKNFGIYCEFLSKYHKYYPCEQIGSVQERLKMALAILSDKLPMKAKYANFDNN